MSKRNVFSKEEASRIRSLLIEKETADKPNRKRIRQHLRDIGFYITDYNDGIKDFKVSDFNSCEKSGFIIIDGDEKNV